MSTDATRLEQHFQSKASSFPRRWSLFFARYRLVQEFEGLEFHTLKGLTARGYEAGFRLGLAYTALETLQKATGRQLPPVKDIKAARILRSLRGSQFEKFLMQTATTTNLRNRLIDMFASQKDMDLLPLVESIRHSVFHGSYTPTSSGFTTDPDVRLLLDLVQYLAVDLIEAELAIEISQIGLVD